MDLKEYREMLHERNYKCLTPGATKIGPKLVDFTNTVASKLTEISTCSREYDSIVHIDGIENFPENTNGFIGYTHSGFPDNFCWIPTLGDKHSFIFHSDAVSKLLKLSQYNTGLIKVKKLDKTSRKEAALDAEKLVIETDSYVAIWPEAVYNLTPSKPMLESNYGVILMALHTGKPIIPCAIEYVFAENGKEITDIYISYCKPIYVNDESEINEKWDLFVEEIATAKWKIWEKLSRKNPVSRNDIDYDAYYNRVRETEKTMKMAKIPCDDEYRSMYSQMNFERKLEKEVDHDLDYLLYDKKTGKGIAFEVNGNNQLQIVDDTLYDLKDYSNNGDFVSIGDCSYKVFYRNEVVHPTNGLQYTQLLPNNACYYSDICEEEWRNQSLFNQRNKPCTENARSGYYVKKKIR